jgi:hypothetical protein
MRDCPDTNAVLAGLKDFQRATVDYVFERFYGAGYTRRFLVADEVGLGKTLIARGVIARIIEHLREKPRIDVIYICSNADIARQNIKRLRIPGCSDASQATRLTLLPLNMDDVHRNRINFVALTPATSFDQTGGGGRIDERVLLYWLLDAAWGIHGSRASLYVMRDYASIESFERAVTSFDFTRVNQQVAAAFASSLESHLQTEQASGKPDLRARFEELRSIFCRHDARTPDGATKQRTQWIGELRRLLARVCLSALEPDMIILDEFQRFKHLLEEESEAGLLARALFDSAAGLGARVLLLSATPYRSLSLHHESEDDHYADFLTLLRFLEDSDANECKEILAQYRAVLPAVMTPGGLERLRAAKNALQNRLQRVMARTERPASSRGGMLAEMLSTKASLNPADIRGFLGAQQIAESLGQGDVVEYWKSAPYLFNFMDEYALKRAFKAAPEQREMVRFVRDYPEAFLNIERARSYKPLDPANARLRDLLSETTDREMWRLLWIPPSLTYYTLGGPFTVPELAGATKQLVFSAWHMVPRAVASLVSYEAERRMMRASQPRGPLTQEDWKKQRGLLRFSESEGRLTGMPLMLLVYPSLTFARDCDPRELARNGRLTERQVRTEFATRIRSAVERLGLVQESGGPPDERWYWVAPMLLDFAEFPEAAQEWWGRENLAGIWAGAEVGEDDEGWAKHVARAQETVKAIRSGAERLGIQPGDLFDTLALSASAAPGTTSLRAYARFADGVAVSAKVRDCAARTGRAFLTLFNRTEVTEAVRAELPGEPYWERVLQYAHVGGLQAVLDEYAHLLRDALGLASDSPDVTAEKMSNELISTLALRAASLRIDNISAPPYAREVKLAPEPMRIRFAMRFGDDRDDEDLVGGYNGLPGRTRKESVRAAFNSPFWPFVLVSTSVGQEGLDFHHYCHSVMHWNLPSNPVDLEQREGRIHRYKGHAVRKNVAAAFGEQAFASNRADVWEDVFEGARTHRASDENDLVPYWIFQGDAKIERHVPALPFSRDIERLNDLRRALAIYRMVFGQSRQEDLITFLLANIPEQERAGIVAELQIDLSPPHSPESRSVGV